MMQRRTQSALLSLAVFFPLLFLFFPIDSSRRTRKVSGLVSLDQDFLLTEAYVVRAK